MRSTPPAGRAKLLRDTGAPMDVFSCETAKTLEQELQTAQQALLAVELKLKPEHPDVRKQRRTVEELQVDVDGDKH